MRILNKLKGIALFISLLYLTFYIPMSLTFYMPQWMKINCGWHDRCDKIGYDDAYRGIEELTAYFRHQGEGLLHFWTWKEKTHLEEVRGIFDKLLIGGLAAAVLIFLTFDRRRASRYALANAIIILFLLVVLPFFGTFWKDIFHPLIFKNDLWMNNKYDLSFYIMPRRFFMYTVALLIALCFGINMAIWALLRRGSK
ncbi:MAG: DUF1461 domain-containing protein [Deltaproteobacteria bacterium]